MKYLLTVDVPDEMGDELKILRIWEDGYGNFWATVSGHRETGILKIDCNLKPMPLRRRTEVVWHDDNGRELITHEYTEKDKTWNEIVDYLEGEE